MKENSIFYPERLVRQIAVNSERYAWVQEMKAGIIAKAEYWTRLSDEEIWQLMFGNTINRSWSVWSDGCCPSCRERVPMYSWVADPIKTPWKMKCPHCGGLFPKNDFHKYYLSGIDESGVFDPQKADRRLLVNEEHPEPGDPLNGFGVDDGEGYVEGGNRWRFIGAYLIYGQWKKNILEGLKRLGEAYVATGDANYAHKAGILLDRIADLYPTFDFARDGEMFEGKNIVGGYVSYCVDACIETRELIIAYDRIFDGIKNEDTLVTFLNRKAYETKGIRSKESFGDIQENVEERILRHAIEHVDKIDCNYPHTDGTVAIARTVLQWDEKRSDIIASLRDMVKKSTSCDGMTGEKGLATYSAWTIQALAGFLEMYRRIDESFLKEMYSLYPQLHQAFRFHIDSWCLESYYPLIGDTGNCAEPINRYLGVLFKKDPGPSPSMYSFLWHMYELTGDTDLVKVLYRANGSIVDNLPHDMAVSDAVLIQDRVKAVIEAEGTDISTGSVNKEDWHLAILRSGMGKNGRALWLHYDSGKDHCHIDGMNIGLYAKRLDLMPDFGYPPVQYGGWYTRQVYWYQFSTSHNTVLVDRKNQSADAGLAGKTTLWCTGGNFKAVRVSAPGMIQGKQYERTLALIDISAADSYILDIFRVSGGSEHTWLMHGTFGELTTTGLELKPGRIYGNDAIMRNFLADDKPAEVWTADWKTRDYYHRFEGDRDIHLRYTGITGSCTVQTYEAWVSLGGYNTLKEEWIPGIMSERRAEDGKTLTSVFVGIIEPYEDKPQIAEVRQLKLFCGNKDCALPGDIAIEVVLKNGDRDLLISIDTEVRTGLESVNGISLDEGDWKVNTDCELCMIRKSGDTTRIVICRGSYIIINGKEIRLGERTDIKELQI